PSAGRRCPGTGSTTPARRTPPSKAPPSPVHASSLPLAQLRRSVAAPEATTRAWMPRRATAHKKEARHVAGLPGLHCASGSVLDVQLGATVHLALAPRQRLRGRLQRTALAVTHRARQTAGVDAVAGQVVVHRGRTTLRQARSEEHTSE